MTRLRSPLLLLALASCAAAPATPGVVLAADSGLLEVRVEALGLE